MQRVVGALFRVVAVFGWVWIAERAIGAGMVYAAALASVIAFWMGVCAWEALEK